MNKKILIVVGIAIAAIVILVVDQIRMDSVIKASRNVAFTSLDYGWRCAKNGTSIEECTSRLRSIIDTGKMALP